MSDPSIDDLTKVGAGVGGTGLLAAVWALIAKYQSAARINELATQVQALTAAVSDLKADVKALVAASERRDDAHERLDGERRFARLEAVAETNAKRLDAIERLLESTVAR